MRTEAERRQLTVLYGDLVGVAAYSIGPDHDDGHEVARACRMACERVIERFDGTVINIGGGGMLACFGWPRAHEDDVERAVRAALALVDAVRAFKGPSGQTLVARVGIATGPIVVDELLDRGTAQDPSAVGEAASMAARVQACAAPGQVVVSESTRRLLGAGFRTRRLAGGNFSLEVLRAQFVKGVLHQDVAYAVTGERITDSRFEARAGPVLPPMVGRDRELALLLEEWTKIKLGRGRAVLLVGEAGIGKSRIGRALLDAISTEPHTRIRFQCSPHHADSALWPVVRQLTHVAGVRTDDSTAASLDKLEALLGASHRDDAAPLIAALLGLDGASRYGRLELSAQAQRERTLEALVSYPLRLAARQPLLLMIEDVHWIDPSTLELIEQLLARIDSARILMFLTSRTENPPALRAPIPLTRLTLNRLARADAQAIVTRLGGGRVPGEMMDTIIERTDGVPLFVEELTKAVLETGETSVPASLHDSLMARLDRAPEIKEVAQLAACIGREFDHALLAAVAEWPQADLRAAVDALIAAELIFRRGPPPGASYTFKHALIQDAAYESLPSSRRRQLHARILGVLEENSGVAAEVLARHATNAELTAKAIDYWQQAGEAALRKSAYHEATHHIGWAIELAETREGIAQRRDRECVLHVRLGQALTGTQGYSAPTTRQAFARAGALLSTVTDPMLRIALYYGVWVGHSVGSEYPVSLELAKSFLAAAQSDGDDAGCLIAHRVLGDSHVITGEFAQAREHLQHALDLYAAHPRPDLIEQLGHEPGGAAACYLAWTLGFVGSTSQARDLLAKACELNRNVSNVNARAYLHFHCALAGMFWRDQAMAMEHATRLDELAAEHRLRMWQAFATTFLAWTTMERGDAAGSLAGYARGFGELSAIGAKNLVPYFASGEARALAACQRVDEARWRIQQAIVDADRTSQRWSDAELWRVRGELFLRGVQRDRDEAERCFERAIAIACSQGAKLWELRAAVSLARLWVDEGRGDDARNLLAPFPGWFARGLATVDAEEAQALLERLA
jgi:class 3 adenylate cyclase/predicted ATPase/ABC-type transport system involved in cytochrome c biogenesis ATPase subunit